MDLPSSTYDEHKLESENPKKMGYTAYSTRKNIIICGEVTNFVLFLFCRKCDYLRDIGIFFNLRYIFHASNNFNSNKIWKIYGLIQTIKSVCIQIEQKD